MNLKNIFNGKKSKSFAEQLLRAYSRALMNKQSNLIQK